jgi:hypothetical protein
MTANYSCNSPEATRNRRRKPPKKLHKPVNVGLYEGLFVLNGGN